MRKLFPGYYRPTRQQSNQMWEDGIFIFDTNVLLNIYRYSPNARNQLFDILKKLQSRIWIPHQVAQEYLSQRLVVISQQFKIYENAENELNNLYKKLKAYKGHPFIDTDRLVSILEEATKDFSNVMDGAKSRHTQLISSDSLMDDIAEIFENNVGEAYSIEDLDTIYQEAEQRYNSKTPPGYEDAKKKDSPNKYGDVVIWYQIIAHAQAQQKPIIFITDDQKDDWWLKHEGIVVGPRPELISELLDKSNVPFFMYQVDRFMERALTFLGLKQQPEIVEEVRGIRQQYEQSLRASQALVEQEYLSPERQMTVSTHYVLDELMQQASVENQKIQQLTNFVSDLEHRVQVSQNYLQGIPLSPERMNERRSVELRIGSDVSDLERLRSNLSAQLTEHNHTIARIQQLQGMLSQYEYAGREIWRREGVGVKESQPISSYRNPALPYHQSRPTSQVDNGLDQNTSNPPLQRKTWGAQTRQPSGQQSPSNRFIPDDTRVTQETTRQSEAQRRYSNITRTSVGREQQGTNKMEQDRQSDHKYKNRRRTNDDKKT